MAADIFGERIHYQARLNFHGVKKVGRRHGVINHINNTFFGTQFANLFKVGYLGGRVSYRFYKNQPRIFFNAVTHIVYRCGIDKRNIQTQFNKRLENAAGIAKQVRAG